MPLGVKVLVAQETIRRTELSSLDYYTHIDAIVFILFDLILYVPVNSFSVMSGQVFLG